MLVTSRRFLLLVAAVPFIAMAQPITVTPPPPGTLPLKFTFTGPNFGKTPRICTNGAQDTSFPCTKTVNFTTNVAVTAKPIEGNAKTVTWLTVAPTGSSTKTVAVTIDITNLKDGYYVGAVELTASGSSNSPLRVPVEVSVFPQDGYSALDQVKAVSGSNNKVTVTNFNVSNGFTVNASVVAISPVDASWLVVAKSNPISSQGSTSVDVPFTVVPSVLNGNSASAYITFTDASSNVVGTYSRVDFTPVNVATPNVVGATQNAATTTLQNAGLAVGTVTMQSSTTVAAGIVINQSPSAGTQVPQGSSVALTVSSGLPPVIVPNVVGSSQFAAATSLQAAGLAVGTITSQASATVAAGNVISQNPVAGSQAPRGSSVTLVISTGAPPVTVPNVVGATQSNAGVTITSVGLLVGQVTTQASTTVPAGSVISQNPTAGAQAVAGTAVNLVVSSGPPQVTVPNVVGATQSAATSTLQGVGLSVGTVTQQASSTVPAGAVISQSPAAGAQASNGTAVNLVVSTGAATVTAPNLVGLTQANATTAIQNAGLKVGTVTNQSSSSVAAGLVISQNPTAGTQVGAGSAVSLVVSSGPDSTAPSIRSNNGILTATQFGGFNAAAPGSWIEIYGANLASGERQWQGSDFQGTVAPTKLGNTTVTVNGERAFVYYISPGQVNAQIPSTVSPGQAQVVVTNGQSSTPPATIQVNAIAPGVLALPVGTVQYAVGLLLDGSYVLPPGSISGVASRRAKPGDVIIFYGVGFGAAKSLADKTPIPAGQVVMQANQLDASFTVAFAGTPATVQYAGLAPTFVGLYQFNVVVPAVADSDTVAITFSVNGTPIRQTLYTAVQR